MRTATASALQKPETANAVVRPEHSRGARLAGLAAASLLPALFWGAFAEAAAYLFHMHLARFAVIIVCSAIALFLAAVLAPIILRDGDVALRNAEIKASARRRPSRI